MRPGLFLFIGILLSTVSFMAAHKPVVHEVKMEGMKFSPSILEIKMGETVRWTNLSSSTHNVVANDNSFKSNMLSSRGDQFEYTFKTGVSASTIASLTE